MIYHIYATKSNIGDWLSALGIQSLLKPFPVQELFCDSPCVDNTLGALAHLSSDDFVIVGGGGLFMDYFRPFWEGFQESVLGKVPYVIWGVGCCDLKNGHSAITEDLITDIVRHSRLCVVRDRLTWTFLRQCQLPNPVPCPSLALLEPCQQPARGILHVTHGGLVSSGQYQRIVKCLQREASKLNLPYAETRNRIDPARGSTLNRELDKYLHSDVVVSSRLHGCIIAVGMGKKVIAISGDRKIDQFMESAGLTDWVLETTELEKLPEKLGSLHLQHVDDEFTQQARSQNMDISTEVRRMIPKVTGLISPLDECRLMKSSAGASV